MNKKLIGAGAILTTLIAVYSGASGWAGLRIEAQSYAAVDAINLLLSRTWSGQVRLTQQDYARGLFSTDATYVLTFPQASGVSPEEKREILFINRTTHGPFPLKAIWQGQFKPLGALIETSVAPTPWTAPLFKATQGRAFITGRTQVSWDGVARLNWTAIPFDLSHAELRTRFGGAHFNADIGPRFSARKGDFNLESLNVTNGQATIDLKDVKLHSDSRLAPGGLSLGQSKREIGSFTWSSVSAPTISLQKVLIRHELNLENSGVEGETNLEIGALSIAQNMLGSFKLNAFYDQLDERALEPLLSLYKRHLAFTAANILAPEPISAEDIKTLWQYFHGLLKNSPNIRIDPLVWQTTNGKSQLSLNVDLKPTELAAGGLGFRNSPLETLDATLTLSQPMIESLVLQKFQTPKAPAAQTKNLADREIKKLLDTAIQLKLGRPQDGKIVAHFNVQDGQLRINGQRASSEPLLKLLSGLAPDNWLSLQTASKQEEPDEAVAIQHLDPEILSAILSRSDFTYEESRDADGDLVLKVAPGDSGAKAIEIIFIGCRKDPTCEEILLRATYIPDQGAALKFVNDWNLRNRWGRAFIGEANAPTLEMDISAYGGIGQDAIESLVSTFFGLVRNFSKELKAAEQKTEPVDAPASAGTNKG